MTQPAEQNPPQPPEHKQSRPAEGEPARPPEHKLPRPAGREPGQSAEGELTRPAEGELDRTGEVELGAYVVRFARREDIDGARSVMLDTFYRVFGHGYVPRWHADVIDPGRAYFDDPRQRLFVAVLDDEVVGTAAVRADGPKSPPHAPWIAERYPSGTTAQIFRVYVRPEHRRHGLARALVDLACRFIADTPGYDTIYLHTNAAIEGAEPFWRSIAEEVHDGRTDPRYSPAVHFEIQIPAR